jgi:hypothetical protein
VGIYTRKIFPDRNCSEDIDRSLRFAPNLRNRVRFVYGRYRFNEKNDTRSCGSDTKCDTCPNCQCR